MALQPSQSSALARRSADTQLMPPPPKRIKRPKNVIDEDSYTDALSEIIARDFFPGLLESETQQEYLDAQESGDKVWISSAGRRLAQVMTPGRARGKRGTSIQTPLRASDTPRGGFAGDTPMSTMSEATTSTQASPVKIDTNMSLDKFQSLYTSEDNESFYKLIDKQNLKRAEKYAWMWSENNQLPSKMMLKQKEIETKLLQSRGSLIDDGGKKDRLAIRGMDEKPARPNAWKSKPNNELMFAPQSVEDSIETVAQKRQTESRAAPRGVAYANTRMPPPAISQSEPEVPPSPSLSAIKDAIAGKRRASDMESDFAGSQTPRVNGYAFVDDEPEEEIYAPAPPIDLGKGEKTKNPFVIKERSKREDLHHRMVDKNAMSKRTSIKEGMTGRADITPVPKFPSSPRVGSGNLTPAAQRLWSRVGNSNTGLSSDAFGMRTPGTVKAKSGLRARWTPSGR
ncbi:nuclear protein DGCR14 [Bisporella sp. PMI_857]|nr:nuclear protein DGCR14 [Bisporella sp. PMI_857]